MQKMTDVALFQVKRFLAWKFYALSCEYFSHSYPWYIHEYSYFLTDWAWVSSWISVLLTSCLDVDFVGRRVFLERVYSLCHEILVMKYVVTQSRNSTLRRFMFRYYFCIFLLISLRRIFLKFTKNFINPLNTKTLVLDHCFIWELNWLTAFRRFLADCGHPNIQ